MAVGLVYLALGSVDDTPNPESPETDGESITAFFQIVGAVMTFVATAVLVARFETTLLIIRRRRARSALPFE